jgi:hypothetical protein
MKNLLTRMLFLLPCMVSGLTLSAQDVSVYVYNPSGPDAQDGIIDLIISPNAGSPPYHILYFKKQTNGQYLRIKEVFSYNNGDEDLLNAGFGQYRVEVNELNCGYFSQEVILSIGCSKEL